MGEVNTAEAGSLLSRAVRAAVAACMHTVADRLDADGRAPDLLLALAMELACTMPVEECGLCGDSLCAEGNSRCALQLYNAHWAAPRDVDLAGELVHAATVSTLRYLAGQECHRMTVLEINTAARLVAAWAPGETCPLCARGGVCEPPCPLTLAAWL